MPSSYLFIVFWIVLTVRYWRVPKINSENSTNIASTLLRLNDCGYIGIEVFMRLIVNGIQKQFLDMLFASVKFNNFLQLKVYQHNRWWMMGSGTLFHSLQVRRHLVHNKVAESQCNAKCPKEQQRSCGGTWMISIYDTDYIGKCVSLLKYFLSWGSEIKFPRVDSG